MKQEKIIIGTMEKCGKKYILFGDGSEEEIVKRKECEKECQKLKK